MADVYKSIVFGGLGTVSFTAPEANNYAVDVKISLPTITSGAAIDSLLIVTVNLNGTPWFTTPSGVQGFHTSVLCAVNDVITIVFASSNPADNSLNVIKSTIAISEGV